MKWLPSLTLMLGITISTFSQVNTSNNLAQPLDQYIVTPNNLKANTGRLLLNFPAQTVWTIYIYKMSDNKYVTSYAHTNAPKSLSMAPGDYKITLNNAPLSNVTIKKSHDTRLRIGVLKIEVNDVWYLYDEGGAIYCSSGNKPSTLVMPVGKYQLKVNNIGTLVTVTEATREELSGERKTIDKEQYIMVPIEGPGKLVIPKHQPFAFPIQVPIYIYSIDNSVIPVYKCGYNILAQNPAAQCPVTYPVPEGMYNIYYAKILFENVEIRKGYETNLKLGYLKHKGQAQYGIGSEDGEKKYLPYSAQSEASLPWPVGKYKVKVFLLDRSDIPIEIKNGETTTIDPLIPPTYVGNLVVTTPIVGHFPPNNMGRVYNSAVSNSTQQGDTSSNLLWVRYPNSSSSFKLRAHHSKDLSPGIYTAFLNGVDFKIQIDSKHESKPRVGYLQVIQLTISTWEVYHKTNTTKYSQHSGMKTIALPVGIYRIKVDGRFFLVKIKDEETLEFTENMAYVTGEWE